MIRVCIALVAASAVYAQPTPAPRFEVATLELSPPPPGDSINIDLGSFRNGRLTLTNASLSDAIKFAYELVSDAQLSGPDWIKTTRFDIVAQAPADTSREQLHAMSRVLLAERLHLVLRREQKVLPHLVLVVGRNGAKVPVARQDAPPNAGPQVPGRIAHNRMPMGLLASLLSRFEQQIIIDRTSLVGLFEVRLNWMPDKFLPPADVGGPPPDRPSLFAAVQEQLGLRLESRRSPLDVFVVEQAAKIPEDN